MANKRNWKARYKTVGPRREKVTYNKYHVDENGSLQFETITEEMDCFMVYFPHGHSIRVTSKERLVELGYHIKPRIVDMETGDIVDLGGDPYDFDVEEVGRNEDLILAEDGELEEVGKTTERRTADASA